MTERCNTCRFWSEMLAQANGGPVEAWCLVEEGPNSGYYTTGRQHCDKWKHNRYGAIDSPPNYGEEARAAYEAEESEAS